jgi:hypothetical protein
VSRARTALLALCVALPACATATGDPCTDDASCGDAAFVCMKAAVSGAPAAIGVCTRPFRAAGERCLSSDDCAPELFCSNSLSTTERLFSGVCTAGQGAGERCRVDRDCASPLRCKGASSAALGACN